MIRFLLSFSYSNVTGKIISLGQYQWNNTKKYGDQLWASFQHLFDRKKARFDTNMQGSTQKCMVRQKCPIQHASVDIAIILPPPHTDTHTFLLRNLCSSFIHTFVLRTHTEMQMKLYWYSNVLMSLWSVKYIHSSLFVMIIMPTAKDKCYECGSIILPIFAFCLIAPKSESHIAMLVPQCTQKELS